MYRYILSTVIFTAILAVMNCSGNNGDIAGHWKFDKLIKDNTITPDASGSGLQGLVHGQTLVDGIVGKAMKFEGYDQIVEVGDLKLNAPATVAFWVRTHDLIRDRRLFSQMEGAENQAGALRFDSTQMEVWDGALWQVLIDRNLRINKWMHVAVVFEENGKTYGFLNGKQHRLVRSGFDFNGVKAGIGAKQFGTSGNLFTGMMDDFRIYRRALSGDEISRLYSVR